MQIQRTFETTASPEQAFDYLSDLTTTNEWDPSTVRTTRRSGDGGLGTVYENTSVFNGRHTTLRYETIAHDRPRRVSLRGTNKTVTATETIEFSPAGSGSRITYTADYDFNGLARLAVPFLGRAFRKLWDDGERGLREQLGRL